MIRKICILPPVNTLTICQAQLHIVIVNGHYNEFQNIRAHTQKSKTISHELLSFLSQKRLGFLTFIQCMNSKHS